MRKIEEEARLERERIDKERLLAIKNKEKREQSAVASSEVKQKLQVKENVFVVIAKPLARNRESLQLHLLSSCLVPSSLFHLPLRFGIYRHCYEYSRCIF